MTALQWQTEIGNNDEPVTDIGDAELALQALGIEYDAIDLDGCGGEQDGIYLVGFVGEHARTLARGDELDIRNNGVAVVVPQP